MSYSVIGGADGPTSIFLAGKIGDMGIFNWFSVFGLIIVVLMLIPNIIYAVKFRNIKESQVRRWILILEQIGRYASMFFMVVQLIDMGFSSVNLFLIYLIGNVILLLVYWIVWILFFIKQSAGKQMALAIIPSVIFLLSGITQMYILLIISALVFGAAHIYITYKATQMIF